MGQYSLFQSVCYFIFHVIGAILFEVILTVFVFGVLTQSFLSVWIQVSPLLPCYIRSLCVVTETALRNVTSLPTRSCHVPRSPEVPMRAWSWPSARNSPALSSMLRTKTLCPPTAPADGGPSFFVIASRVTASCCPSLMHRCPATRPAGTRPKQPWACWSATRWRSWGYCRSHNLVFGLVMKRRDFTAGTSWKEEDRHNRGIRATAKMIVSWTLKLQCVFVATLVSLVLSACFWSSSARLRVLFEGQMI